MLFIIVFAMFMLFCIMGFMVLAVKMVGIALALFVIACCLIGVVWLIRLMTDRK